MKTMKLLALFVAVLLTADVSAAAAKASSFGGASKSTVTSGGGSKSSFGGASKSTPTITSPSSYTTRSTLPTRSTPVMPPPSYTPSNYTPPKSPFGGTTTKPPATPTVTVQSPVQPPKSPFGGATSTPSVATNTNPNGRNGFGGTTSTADRNNLPTRTWQPKPQVATKSSADIALENRARSSGTLFNNRQDAITSFKQKYNTTYVSTYTVQPTVWPTHIPHTYSYNNFNYNITYSPQYHGYGYWYSGGWRSYDVFDDLVMLDVLMNQHSYYVPPPVVYQTPYQTPTYQTQSYDPNTGSTTTTTTYTQQPPVVVQSGPPPSFGTVMIVLGVIFGIVIVVAVVANLNKGY